MEKHSTGEIERRFKLGQHHTMDSQEHVYSPFHKIGNT